MSRKFLRRFTPTDDSLRRHPGLRWLGPLLQRPWLWHMNRRTVALGMGIGVFFGFLVPILQIGAAAVFAVALRANLPVAAAATLVSNPFTYAPIGVAAYKVGSALLGERPSRMEEMVIEEGANAAVSDVGEVVGPGWWERFAGIGKPLMLGLTVFAVIGGASAYVLTLLAWRVALAIRVRRRRRARDQRGRVDREAPGRRP